jgi:hypothetical protein
MEKPGKKQPPQTPDSAVPGQPGPMAPPDHPAPWEPDAMVGLTQGHAADAEDYDSGDADLMPPKPVRPAREDEGAPKLPDRDDKH